MVKTLLKVAVVGIAAIVVLAVAVGMLATSDGTGTTANLARSVTPAVVVTMSEYSTIVEGLSYEDVTKIIGAPGKELSSNAIGGVRTVMYSWTNPGGSNMNAMFQNDKLIQKAQFGLQ